MNNVTNCDLDRFIEAQEVFFERAYQELLNGRKKSHWIWFIFPQVEGLGASSTAVKYAITSKHEAIAYLNHPILGQRLKTSCEARLEHSGTQSIDSIMGYPDNLKLNSSMTLFSYLSESENLFSEVLTQFYDGAQDRYTIGFLEK